MLNWFGLITVAEILSDRDIDEFSKKLNDEQRSKLLLKLLNLEKTTPPIIIIGGCNSIHSTGVLQLNGDPEKIAEQLLQSDPELIASLLKGLGIYVQSKHEENRHNERSESS